MLKYALLVVLIVGCSGSRDERAKPEAALSTSHAAQEAFRTLYSAWTARSERNRPRLVAMLEDFLRRYPHDGRAHLVTVYLAWMRVEQGRFAEAQRLSDAVADEPAGATRDLATVVRAAIMRHKGEKEKAYVSLRGLRGKIVDPYEHELFSEQLVLAAIAVERQKELFAYLIDWLESAGRVDPARTLAKVEATIDQLEQSVLESFLQDPGGPLDPHGSERERARAWLLERVRTKLTESALAAKDAELAKRLVTDTPGLGQDRSALVELASRGRRPPKVVGRTLGLLVDLRNESTRRRSAQVARGISSALGLPRLEPNPAAPDLVVQQREGTDEMSQALARLAALGAVVLAGGVDVVGATEIAQFAERERIVALTFVPPDVPKNRLKYAFTVGIDPDAVTTEFGVDFSPEQTVGPECPPPSNGIDGGRFPIASWKRSGIDLLLLLGDAQCSAALAREVERQGFRPTLALGLESAERFFDLPARRLLTLTAGAFPLSPSNPPSPGSGPRVSWFQSLGHDAALFAASAMRALPLTASSDPKTVARLHAQMRERLLGLSVPGLWTTRARRFQDQQLPRVFAVKERKP